MSGSSPSTTRLTPTRLTLVSESLYRLDRPPESLAERVRRRQLEARMLAREHVGMLLQALSDAEALAGTVAQGGDIYPAGVREATGRLRSVLGARSATLEALLERIPEPEL